LNLQPPGEHIYDAGHLRQADDLAVGDVSHMRPPEERQQVMLAQRVHLDVAHHDHALVGLFEYRVSHHVGHRLVIALREPAKRALHPFRSLDQTLSLRIFAQRRQHLLNQAGDRVARSYGIGRTWRAIRRLHTRHSYVASPRGVVAVEVPRGWPDRSGARRPPRYSLRTESDP